MGRSWCSPAPSATTPRDATASSSSTYEAYESAATDRFAEIAAEARRRWPTIGRLAMVHRVGALEVSAEAVVVVVSAPHRDEAFDSARYVIDTLKADGADLEARDVARRCRLGHRRDADP